MKVVLCLALFLCVAVFYTAEARSVMSKKEKEEGALQRVLTAVKQVKKKKEVGQRNKGSGSPPAEKDPFLSYKDMIADHCGEELLRFFSDEPDQVSLGEVADLLSHISDYSEQAADIVNGHADEAENLGGLFDDPEQYFNHLDLADQFMKGMEYLNNESFCAFAPVFPVVFRMEVFGVEGVESCDAMMWRYIQLANEVETMEHTCESWGSVAHELTESFKSDLQCLREDVNSFHEHVEDAVDDLHELNEESGEELISHTELMSELTALGNGMERIGSDADMLYYGIHGVGEILAGLYDGGCFTKKEVKNELDLEEKRLQDIMNILKQMK